MLFAAELGVLVLGFAVSLALTIVVYISFGPSQDSLAQTVFLSGLVLSLVGFVAMRRKTRPWMIEYDAAGWARSRAERKLHPTRARYKRIARRLLVWVPSMIAALVLFFLPVATHLVHPRSHYLRHYTVPIPWNFAVFSSPGPPAAYSYVQAFASSSGNGRFGVTPFWSSKALSSQIVFGSLQQDAGSFRFNHKYRDLRREGIAGQRMREFKLGDVAFTCWQYPSRVRVGSFDTEPLWWRIDCETPVDVREHNLYAWFVGRELDIPAFYRIIEGVKPVK